MGPLTEDSPRVHSPCTPAPSLPHSTLSSSLAAMLFKWLIPTLHPNANKKCPGSTQTSLESCPSSARTAQ